MMRHLLLVFFVLLLSCGLWAQDWQIVREGEAEYYPNAGFFYDAMTGWYVGEDGVVVKTEDGGLSGSTLRMPDSSGFGWSDVEFVTPLIGYACGDAGMIFKSVDGGQTWTMIADTANYIENLYTLDAVDENIVYFAGKASTFLKTVDGGATYTKSDFAFGEDLDGGLAFTTALKGVVACDANSGTTWYTEDGGVTWTKVLITFPAGSASSRLYDIAGAGVNTFIAVGYHNTVFWSNDGGKSYTHVGEFDPAYVQHRWVDAVDSLTVVAGGTSGHIVMTVDGGANWNVINSPSGQTIAFVDFVDASNGFVFGYYGQWFRTVNGGQEWIPILQWPNVSFWGLALPTDDKIVLTGWGGGEVTLSEDGGETWTYPDNLASGSTQNLYEVEFVNASRGWFGGGSGDLRITKDGGHTWELVDNPMYQGVNLHINAMHVSLQTEKVLVAGSKGTVIVSDTLGETWVTAYNKETQTIYDLWTDSDNRVVAAAGSGQIYRSNAALDSFKLVKDYGSMLMRAVETRGNVGLVAASAGSIYRTENNAWDNLTAVYVDPDGSDFYDIEFVNDSTVYVVGEDGKICKSVDMGLTWTAEPSPVSVVFQKVRYRNHKLWVVGQNGYVLLLDSTPIPPPPPPPPVTGLIINEFLASNDGSVQDEFGDADDWFEIFNTNDDTVNIAGLFVTDDLADPYKWQIPDSNLTVTSIPPGGFLVVWADEDMEQGPLHVDFKLGAGGESIGIFQNYLDTLKVIDSLSFGPQKTDTTFGRTTDGGSEWAYFQPGSPGASNTNGVVVAIEERSDVLVKEYKLNQNYPNPFNPVTNIEFAIKEPGKVLLTVYNTSGQKVATLLNDKLPAGVVKLTWDARHMPSGVYFYELRSGSFKQVRKMVLMK